MANAVEDALNRANEAQKVRNQQVIEEARRNIKLVSMQQGEDISSLSADSMAQQARVIEEAKRTIPYETMQNVDTVSSPLPTPNDRANYTSKVVSLHPQTQEKIEEIEQGEGNNYLHENAVDRAMDRQSALIKRAGITTTFLRRHLKR